jgi:hypothetical protein
MLALFWFLLLPIFFNAISQCFSGGDELACGNAWCLCLAVAGGGTYRSHRFTLVDLVVEGTLGCICDLV